MRRDASRRWQLSGRNSPEYSGWDLQDALTAACGMIAPRSYLEIGVDGGGSFYAVLEAAEIDRAVLCDIWNPVYCDHGLASHEHITAQLVGFPRAPKVLEFLDGDSREKVPGLAGQTFDLITVDGGHSAEVAEADLENCWPLVRTGGMLAFDDVRHPEYPHLDGVFRSFLARHDDALLVPEEDADWRKAALLVKA